jgi:hypothetical protein
MSEKTYSQVMEAGYLSLLNTLPQSEWGQISAPTAPSPAEVIGLSPLALSKVLLMRALLGMRRILHPDPAEAADLRDQDWDRVQRLLDADIIRLENSKDPQARADGALLRAATLKGHGTGQTNMRYEAEVQWGFLQVQKAEEPSLQAAIARHDLTERFEEIASTTSALADAIGWSADTARVSPSIRRRAALRGCAQACALADKTLLALLDLLPVGSPEAARVASLLSTLRKILG